MPLVDIHRETFQKVDSVTLAKLAADAVRERKNSDMLCALIQILIKREAFSEFFDVKAITDPLSFEFFQKQFVRACSAAA